MICSNTTIIKCATYAIVAALTALLTDLEHIKDITSLQSGEILRVIVNILLQVVIAVKAFLDPSTGTTTNISNSEINVDNSIEEIVSPSNRDNE